MLKLLDGAGLLQFITLHCTKKIKLLVAVGYVQESGLAILESLISPNAIDIVVGLGQSSLDLGTYARLQLMKKRGASVNVSTVPLHCKLYVTTGEVESVCVGSSNLSSNGFGKNAELNIATDDPGIWNGAIKTFNDLKASAVSLNSVTPIPMLVGDHAAAALTTPVSFTVQLYKSHVEWGTSRYNRPNVKGRKEAYIAIPNKYATAFPPRAEVFEVVTDTDDRFLAKATGGGPVVQGVKYGKNLQSYPNLDIMGDWLLGRHNAKAGDKVTVSSISSRLFRLEFQKASAKSAKVSP